MQLFKEGLLEDLWTDLDSGLDAARQRRSARVAARSGTPADLPPSTIATVRGLVEEGAFSKAARHLTSEGLADVSDPGVAEKLRDLHPLGPSVDFGDSLPHPGNGPAQLPPDLEDWETFCFQAISYFPVGSAPGPSGLRPSHLKDCIRKAGSTIVLRQGLAQFVKVAATGKLHPNIQPTLCSSTLIPLRKKDGGIRPIAIGDTIRRIVGKVLLRLPDVKTELECLQPRQCGVGVPYATELVGMGVQRLADVCPINEWVILQVDVRNAFNTIHRPAMLQQCLRKTPSIYDWLSWYYSRSCSLTFQGTHMAMSSTGVHQGDALGPIGFSLGLEAALDNCREQEEALPWACWYLDDGTILGSLQAVGDYLEKLVPALQEIGLQVNPSKCTLWGPGIRHEDDMDDHIPDSWPLGHHYGQFPLFPTDPVRV